MVSAWALAKRPGKLNAATVAAEFFSSDLREVVMAFLPWLRRFCGRLFCTAQLPVFGDRIGESTPACGLRPRRRVKVFRHTTAMHTRFCAVVDKSVGATLV